MNRRSFLLGAAGVLACPLCAGLSSRTALAAGDKPHWSYEGASGPDSWGKLDRSYSACGMGAQQSPVDLSGAVRAEVSAGSVMW